MTRRASAAAALAILFVAACTHVRSEVDVAEVDPVTVERTETPVRAHVDDGTVVLFPDGVSIRDDTLHGTGLHYGLDLALLDTVLALSLDRVVGLDTYRETEETMVGASLLSSAAVTALAIVGTTALAKALFGSCPTFYATSGDDFVLEAEGFSYSIAPLLEGRDLDRLAAGADAGGRVELELRNEALETHYLNHLELLEVAHSPEEMVLPDPRSRPIVVGEIAPPTAATDRAGRDVAALLRSPGDGAVYATAPEVVGAPADHGYRDHVDIRFPRPRGRDTVALVIRMRNSLLNTLLFYDFMLARQGLGALDWLGDDLETIGSAVELARWYRSHLGLRVHLEEGGRLREIARIPDAGPIAWKDVAVLVPLSGDGEEVRIRLSALADEWRIDAVRLAGSARPQAGRPVPLAEVRTPDGRADPDALSLMSRPDEAYLVTGPGRRFTLRFEAGPEPGTGARTFLLASQGYYNEWIRPDWLRGGSPAEPFRPGDHVLQTLYEEWAEVKEDLEERFYATRIPVR